MEHDRHPSFADATPRLLIQTLPAERHDSFLGDVGWWLTGGGSLLLWTAIALVLTRS
jgi:hypothetical protein